MSDPLQDVDVRALAGPDEAAWCAHVMATSEPWLTLRRSQAEALRTLTQPGREVHVAHVGGAPGGFVILDLVGALVGYVRVLCVAPEMRGRGLGTRLLTFAERRIFSQWPNVFLCVSSFNRDARRLYERLGYETVGVLGDYIVSGHDEILLRKTRGPLEGYEPPTTDERGPTPILPRG